MYRSPQTGSQKRVSSARRSSTQSSVEESARNKALVAMPLEESFDRPAPSLTSIPTQSSSWESVSEGEENKYGKSKQRDRRKAVDTSTTPTLVDEEDVSDEEIVSYEQEHQRRSKHESGSRRTPGASMYSSTLDHRSASLRRTPGASAMHRSARGAADTAMFGLTLSTPVTASSGSSGKEILAPVKSMDSYSSSADSAAQQAVDQPQQPPRPPRAPDHMVPSYEERESLTYTPAGMFLSKNPYLEVSHGSFSPFSSRLASDIDNLLLDDDETPSQASLTMQQVFRSQLSGQSPVQMPGKAEEEGKDSWMKSFMFDKDGGNASRRSDRQHHGRSRRASGRRSRQGDLTKDGGTDSGRDTPQDFAATAQKKPKAVRRTQGASENRFAMGSFEDTSPKYSSGLSSDSLDRSGSRSLNFGGAFVPTSKEVLGSSFRGFAPMDLSEGPFSTTGKEVTSGSFQPTSALPPGGPVSNAGAFSATSLGAAQPPAPPLTQSQFILPQQGAELSSQAPSFHPGAAGYGATSFGSQQTQYQPSQSFVPSHGQTNANSTYVRPGWTPAMPFGSTAGHRDAGWHSGDVNHSWAPVDEYGYDVTGMVDPRMAMTPSPQFPGWDGEPGGMDLHHYPSQHLGTHGYMGGSGHGGFAVSVSPIPHVGQMPLPPMSYEDARAGSQAGRKNRKDQSKGQGKASKKKAESKQTSADKTKKKDSAKKSAPPSPKKKKQLADASRADGGEDGDASMKSSPKDAKRAELVESPATRSAFKEFYREFRARERNSLQEAEAYAFEVMEGNVFPEKIHWRVYLELADLAKRTNRFDEARKRFEKTCQLQPYASQGWLEYSKLEEECGDFKKCSRILREGLRYCELSENLLTRTIKHEEKEGNILTARQTLARLKHVGIEKVWRVVLEGAMMEARVGKSMMARQVLKVLMHHVPWYGPLYLEAYRLERDLGNYSQALSIVDRGIAAIPRYGPLWFGAFRICEMLDTAKGARHLPRTTAMLKRASTNISRELTWKVHLEAAQIYERNAIQVVARSPKDVPILEENLRLCRERFALTIATCPPNLSWKVWLASGRMELSAGNQDKARSLFLRAGQVVPEKGRVAALLECARLEEYIGNADLARALLCQGRFDTISDWKIWLESVLLEVRSGHYSRAVGFAKRALELHNGTGRLWAALVQLRHYEGGEDAQYSALKRALRAVPKSGEVWCEGGRIHMNPFCKVFDLKLSCVHLNFAARFTPQYGDSFLEAVKLNLLEDWITLVAYGLWEKLEGSYRNKIMADKNGDGGTDQAITDVVRRAFKLVRVALKRPTSDEDFKTGDESEEAIVSFLRESLSRKFCDAQIDLADLELRCANADPNYGVLWFHCRQGPIDTARAVIASSREILTDEVLKYAEIYVAAIIRRFAVMVALKHELKTGHSTEKEETAAEDDRVAPGVKEAHLLAAPSLQEILENGPDDEAHGDLLEGSLSGCDFVTGLVEINKHLPLQDMPPIQRRKTIFGSDALFS